MKKLIYLFLGLLIVACSSDDSSDNDPFDCADFDSTTSQSSARQKAISYDSAEYNRFVSAFGQPIDEGYFIYDYGDGTYDYSYMFLFLGNDDSSYGYEVTNYCITFGTTEYPSCDNGAINTLEDLFFDDVCDNFPFGPAEDYTRIY